MKRRTMLILFYSLLFIIFSCCKYLFLVSVDPKKNVTKHLHDDGKSTVNFSFKSNVVLLVQNTDASITTRR